MYIYIYIHTHKLSLSLSLYIYIYIHKRAYDKTARTFSRPHLVYTVGAQQYWTPKAMCNVFLLRSPPRPPVSMSSKTFKGMPLGLCSLYVPSHLPPQSFNFELGGSRGVATSSTYLGLKVIPTPNFRVSPGGRKLRQDTGKQGKSWRQELGGWG